MKVLIYWRFHPLRVLERDRIGYGNQRDKHFKESITDFVATACNFNKEEILSNNNRTCQKCTDMGRLTNAFKGKN